MKNTAISLLLLCAACGSAGSVLPNADAGLGHGGAGGGSPAPITSSASSMGGAPTSSASGGGGPQDGGCSTCFGALHGQHVLSGFCAASASFSDWAAYVACGCNGGGACAPDCAGGAWCAGVLASSSWTDPSTTCGNCLAAAGPTGCGDQAIACGKD